MRFSPRSFFGISVAFVPPVGMVSKVRHRQTGIEYAMKTVQLGKISPSILREMRNEIEILKRLDHPNTIREFQYILGGDRRLHAL